MTGNGASGGRAEVVVAGSGAAGLVAATYLRRAGIATVVVEGDPFDAYDMPGGQLMLTETAHQVPGFPEGTPGPELMDAMRRQAEGEGTEFVSGTITGVDLSGPEKVVRVAGDDYACRAVVIATGARPKLLGLAGEDELLGRGVSLCAMCDAPLFTDKDVVVVGGGDTAYEEAQLLARTARHVTVVQRSLEPDAAPGLVAAVAEHPRIEVRAGAEVVGYVADGGLTAVRVAGAGGAGPSEHEDVEAAGVFLAVGRVPNTELFAPWVPVDAAGYVVTERGARTAVPGVFACGECQDPVYRQFATAAGSGCMAGMDAAEWVRAAARAGTAAGS